MYRVENKWKPPRSPIGMLQEDMWPDEWKILVVCSLHNQTSRKQVDKVYEELFETYPNPTAMSEAVHEELVQIIRPLGFHNRRARALVRMSKDFLDKKSIKIEMMAVPGKRLEPSFRSLWMRQVRG